MMKTSRNCISTWFI